MPSWVQINGKLVPKEQVRRKQRKGPHIQPDIKPYEVVGGPRYGQIISSRSEHREYLRQNNLMEAGSEFRAFGLTEDPRKEN